MRVIKNFIEKFTGFGETRYLYRYEKVILESLFVALPKELVMSFEKQILGIRRVQRLSLRKEVNIYGNFEPECLVNSLNDFDENRSEYCLGKVSFSYDENTNFAKIWVVNGRIFSINFHKSPMELEKQNVVVTSVRWYSDATNESGWDSIKIKGEIDEWKDEGFWIPKILEEVWTGRQEAQNNLLDFLLPLSKVRKISGENDMLILAEDENGGLILKSGSLRFYFINFSSGKEFEFDDIERAVMCMKEGAC